MVGTVLRGNILKTGVQGIVFYWWDSQTNDYYYNVQGFHIHFLSSFSFSVPTAVSRPSWEGQLQSPYYSFFLPLNTTHNKVAFEDTASICLCNVCDICCSSRRYALLALGSKGLRRTVLWGDGS